MKKQLILLISLFAYVSSICAMHRGKIYIEGTEGPERHYHPCWQRIKHMAKCPCGTICKYAIEAVQTGDTSLLKPHLSHVNSTVDDKTLFDYMCNGQRIEHYPAIYALLLAKGFDPLTKHGKSRETFYDIIDMQDLELFKMSLSRPFNDREKCKCEQYFRYLYRKIDSSPLERNIFYYQALGFLTEKNPRTALKAIAERMADRERRRTVASTNLRSEPTPCSDCATLIHHHSESIMPCSAWNE